MPNLFEPSCATMPSLSTVSTSIARTEREYMSPPNMIRILCASDGSCRLVLPDRQVNLIGERMAYLTGSVKYHIAEPSEDFALTRLDIAMEKVPFANFSIQDMEKAFPEFARLHQGERQCVVFYDNYELVLTALQSLHTFSTYDPLQRKLQVGLTLCFLLSSIATSQWDDDLPEAQYSKNVYAAIRYIHENYMCSISTTEIAAAAGVHVGHLHRIFLAETGQRIGEYLTDLRIEKAKSLLMRTDISTGSVARRIGVSTLQYFSRLFKKHVGMTPHDFRKSYALTCDYSELDADSRKEWEP
ncbi:MAG TPA: helix-turn-helix transcriptional regulator [Candidatus Limiplasma sp.]|nr:helix-turn-helix transcriptional regulator [Candidatus Limiplasma sp.]